MCTSLKVVSGGGRGREEDILLTFKHVSVIFFNKGRGREEGGRGWDVREVSTPSLTSCQLLAYVGCTMGLSAAAIKAVQTSQTNIQVHDNHRPACCWHALCTLEKTCKLIREVCY